MIEVRFPDKNANRVLSINGELIRFENGSAMVTEEQADVIRELKNPGYTVVEPEEPKEKVKPKGRGKKVIKKE